MQNLGKGGGGGGGGEKRGITGEMQMANGKDIWLA